MVKSTLGNAELTAAEFWMMHNRRVETRNVETQKFETTSNADDFLKSNGFWTMWKQPISQESPQNLIVGVPTAVKPFSKPFCCRAALHVAEDTLTKQHQANLIYIGKTHSQRMTAFEADWSKKFSDHYFASKKAPFELAERLRDERSRHMEKCAKDVDGLLHTANLGDPTWTKTAAHLTTQKKYGCPVILQEHNERMQSGNVRLRVREHKLKKAESDRLEWERTKVSELKQHLSSVSEAMRLQHRSERDRLEPIGKRLQTEAEQKHRNDLAQLAQEWKPLGQCCQEHVHLHGLVARL